MRRLDRLFLLASFALIGSYGTAAEMPPLAEKAYPGTLELSVDLTDAPRHIFRVHEWIPAKPGPLVLLYPKWIPGEHGPTGPLEAVAGLRISAAGQRISWRRDLEDMYALNVPVPPGADGVELEFEYLSPIAGGMYGRGVSATGKLVVLEWNQVVLYPAGAAARKVQVRPSVTLPKAWDFASALEPAESNGPVTRFNPVNLETLVDSPLIAGSNFKRIDISTGAAPPVHLDLIADRPENLTASDKQIQQYRALVEQAYALFASRHYRHYDFLLTLSDQTIHFGLEHHQSSDNRTDADFFTSGDSYIAGVGLLPHEYVHSWNGKFRRPTGLVTANFNSPYKDDLLWVYEGLTTYYGDVLTARSGLWTPEQFRDHVAVVAARMSHVPGRSWRPLQDTADEAEILYVSPRAWRNWRRGADFYDEGSLIWLDVDTTIRQASGGARSLDDFARAFFGGDDVRLEPRAYTFDDVVAALSQVQKYDWRAFLSKRLQSTEEAAPLDGLARAGWKLVYTEEPGEYSKAFEKARKMIDLSSSIGLVIGGWEEPNAVVDVIWGGPAFDAGVVPGMKLVAVNGNKFGPRGVEVLKDAIKATKNDAQPIELLVEYAGNYLTLKVNYRGAARYPHLERIENTEDRLSAIGMARK
jgi:predicted metalloprotease with PDZ domain